MAVLNHKTEVMATSRHPNRPEGQRYLLTTALVETLRDRGFVVLPGEKTDTAEAMLPKAIRIIKPKETKVITKKNLSKK